MQSPDVKKIIGRILCDEAFANAFKADAHAAMAQFTLTDSERKALKKLDLSSLDAADLQLAKDIDRDAIRVGALYVS